MTGENETGHQRANAVTRENGSGKETSAKNKFGSIGVCFRAEHLGCS